MSRPIIPKPIREKVLNEYNHRCAIGSEDKPHLHHIDEDPTNNDIMNLIPLCPNCHLTDQHNPTKKIEQYKLQLFRQYKDPCILKSQFHPLYSRFLFLNDIDENDDSSTRELEKQSETFLDFIEELEMGKTFAKEIKKLTQNHFTIVCDIHDKEKIARKIKQHNKEHRKQIIDNKDKIVSLIIEILRYQSWN
ncbi:MAG: HNH endonuclease [Victivallaceae bacterium]|nr:HNH endonuclease [Victivallaceae bacterium]